MMPILSWFVSTTGQAIATWLSASLSLLAIGIALRVAIIEQNRAHADQLRELTRDIDARAKLEEQSRQKHVDFVENCSEVLQQAISIIETSVNSIPNDSRQFVDWMRLQGPPRDIYPALQSVKALQAASSYDARLIVELGRAIRTLEEVCQPITGDSAPSGAKVHRFAGQWLGELRASLRAIQSLK